jgi:hypothetical protein
MKKAVVVFVLLASFFALHAQSVDDARRLKMLQLPVPVTVKTLEILRAGLIPSPVQVLNANTPLIFPKTTTKTYHTVDFWPCT